MHPKCPPNFEGEGAGARLHSMIHILRATGPDAPENGSGVFWKQASLSASDALQRRNW